MKAPRINTWSGLALFATAALALTGATGCQTTIGGQTLPSAYFLSDDVQYFPAGPQDKLFNERRALEQYTAGQQAQVPGGAEAPTPGAPPAENP
jgi:hypothetical protein